MKRFILYILAQLLNPLIALIGVGLFGTVLMWVWLVTSCCIIGLGMLILLAFVIFDDQVI